MISIIRAQLRFRRGRLVATIAAVAVAVASFALLVSAEATAAALAGAGPGRDGRDPAGQVAAQPADGPAARGGVTAGCSTR